VNDLVEIDPFVGVTWRDGIPSPLSAAGPPRGAVAYFGEEHSDAIRRNPQVAASTLSFTAERLRTGATSIDCALIPEVARRAVEMRYRELLLAGAFTRGDVQNAGRYVWHSEPLARSMQLAFESFVSRLAGQRLKATYTYSALYEGDSTVPMHTDREQCELTLALCLARRPQAPHRPAAGSFLIVENGRATTIFPSRPGRGVLFRGRALQHGRIEIGPGDRPWIVLLHYVRADFTGVLS
jgi:hypothetical protein